MPALEQLDLLFERRRMATDQELDLMAKRLDAENEKKKPKGSRKKKTTKKAASKRVVKRVAKKAAPKRTGARAASPQSLTVVLPKGAHLAVVGNTYQVVGACSPATKKTSKKTTKKAAAKPKRRKKKGKDS